MPRFLSARCLSLLAWLAIAAAASSSSSSSPPPPPPLSLDPAAAADTLPPTTNLTAGRKTTILDGFGTVQNAAIDTLADQTANRVEAEVVYLGDADKGHDDVIKPTKIKRKKRPLGQHKKKKQSFKDKLMPLLIIPFAIQTMLIPWFIMNLNMLALKAMAIGKFAILLIAFNMIRTWSQNAHSTSISGSSSGNSMLMAQNYGYNGGPEFGALFNG